MGKKITTTFAPISWKRVYWSIWNPSNNIIFIQIRYLDVFIFAFITKKIVFFTHAFFTNAFFTHAHKTLLPNTTPYWTNISISKTANFIHAHKMILPREVYCTTTVPPHSHWLKLRRLQSTKSCGRRGALVNHKFKFASLIKTLEQFKHVK